MSLRIDYNGHAIRYSNNYLYHIPTELPHFTMRLKFTNGITPTFSKGSAVQLSASPNVWDLTYQDADWTDLLKYQTDLLEILDANTTGVTNMVGLVLGCENLTTVPLFDTSGVTNMMGMFGNCSAITSVPLFDTSNVTNMQSMFAGCRVLTAVPLFDTSKVLSFTSMLEQCRGITTVPSFNTSSALSMGSMFHECTSLTTVPLFDTSLVVNMNQMFRDCWSLKAIPLLDTSSSTDMRLMCAGCTEVESGALALYQQASSQAVPPSSYTRCFYDCGRDTTTGAAELALIPSDWK